MKQENAKVAKDEDRGDILTRETLASTSAEPLAFRVVRGGLFVAASSYFNILFGFLANLILTRLLAPEAFGTFALAMFFFSLINLRPGLG